jgi:hypothetical protein
VVYVPPPCPDDCLGQGYCKNVSVDNSTTNYTKVCVCYSGYFGVNCGGSDNTISATVIAATSLGVGAIIAIVIVAILASVGGGGAYAYSQLGGAETDVAITNNPLFKPSDNVHSNPLNEAR